MARIPEDGSMKMRRRINLKYPVLSPTFGFLKGQKAGGKRKEVRQIDMPTSQDMERIDRSRI